MKIVSVFLQNGIAIKTKYFCFNFKLLQVRIKIIEGRQLSGANINPVVRVMVANNTRQSKVKTSTNKPFFDEVSKYILITECEVCQGKYVPEVFHCTDRAQRGLYERPRANIFQDRPSKRGYEDIYYMASGLGQ